MMMDFSPVFLLLAFTVGFGQTQDYCSISPSHTMCKFQVRVLSKVEGGLSLIPLVKQSGANYGFD